MPGKCGISSWQPLGSKKIKMPIPLQILLEYLWAQGQTWLNCWMPEIRWQTGQIAWENRWTWIFLKICGDLFWLMQFKVAKTLLFICCIWSLVQISFVCVYEHKVQYSNKAFNAKVLQKTLNNKDLSRTANFIFAQFI